MSDARDRRLGMDRGITRRDFLNGVALTVGASLTRASSSFGLELVDDAPEKAAGYYPPALTGLRGSHEGSYAAASSIARLVFLLEVVAVAGSQFLTQPKPL